ncbi:MAG TPA: phage holin family protein [Thermoanaerobaculia bacterium]|nr:phage holin family protein [Thermoanaerobaculia bacterium]
MQPIKDERSLGQILKELTSETSTLLRQEVELAKTEMSEKATRVGTNVGALAVGGAVAFLGALALLFAVIYGLTSLLDQFMSLRVAVWLAPLLVGLVLAGVGYSMMKKARETLKHEGIAPRKTTDSLQENKEWLKTKMQ